MEDNKFDQLLEELDKDSQYFHEDTCSAVFTNKDGARSDTITDNIEFFNKFIEYRNLKIIEG